MWDGWAGVSCEETAGYFLLTVPGVVLESSGALGLMWPKRFSAVLDWTFEGPGPAVDGFSPSAPEVSTALVGLVEGCWYVILSVCWSAECVLFSCRF
jgi:hypothetical protein